MFFAYIGFDVVATTAEEAKNPQRDLPIGIIASLVICTILYVAVALVITGHGQVRQDRPEGGPGDGVQVASANPASPPSSPRAPWPV